MVFMQHKFNGISDRYRLCSFGGRLNICKRYSNFKKLIILMKVTIMKNPVTVLHFQSSAHYNISTIHTACSQDLYMNHCSLLG